MWRGLFYAAYKLGEWFWINSTVKMETRHPVEESVGSEFPSISNQCWVMDAWSRKTLIFKKCVFLEKRPLTVKFLKVCSESFHRLADRRVVCKFHDIWFTENRWNCSPDKKIKILPGSPAVATVRIAPKIWQGQPPTMWVRVRVS